MITLRELDSVYGAPGDWYYRIIRPDGEVVLTSGGDQWRLWQSKDWDNLFWVVWHVWNGYLNGTRIQLYIDGLIKTSKKRTAERGVRSPIIVHADLLVNNSRNRSQQELFEHIVPEFKVTLRDSPELLPDWVPGSLSVRQTPPVWEDLL